MLTFPTNYNGLTISETPCDSYPYVVSQAAIKTKKPIIYIAVNDIKAKQSYEIIKFLLPNHHIYLFPAWDILPYDRISPNASIISQRLDVLSKLSHNRSNQVIIITTVNALTTKTIPKNIIKKNYLEIEINNKISQTQIINFLISNSYIRSQTVNDQGEFAIKGSLFDIFPLGYDFPVRLDFLGNTIESMKEFDPITQITTQKISHLKLIPASEVILSDEFIQNFKTNYKNLFTVNYNEDLLYESISIKRQYIGMENWLPLFYNNLDSLTDYIDSPLIICDKLFTQAIEERVLAINDYYDSRKNLKRSHGEEIYNPIPTNLLYFSRNDIQNLLNNHEIITLDNFSSTAKYAIESNIKQIPNFFLESKTVKKPVFELLQKFLHSFANQESQNTPYICNITAHNEITLNRLKDILSSYDLTTKITDKLPIKASNVINLIKLPLESGFVSADTIFISEQDLLGTKVIRKESKRRKAERLILEAGSLSIGEYIVHKEHGIGKFIGLKTLDITNSKHDFISLEYFGGDKLYLPVENLELISKYGSEHDMVKLDKLGSSNFQDRKSKLKKRIKDIAAELINLASQRLSKKGLVFDTEEEFMQEFVSRFKFDETMDQLSAIDDVLSDLKKGKIMDRLVCGDVGFGKTEIAMRAAFAVINSYNTQDKAQIAIIVPTTLLARQHFKNL